MSSNKALDDLEDRYLALEFARLKKLRGSRSMVITQPAAKASANSSWQYRATVLKNGKTLYEIRTGSGDWTELPKDRKDWPADVRRLEEIYETVNKKRINAGRMISNSVSGGLKVS
jgi:hypothetical protein